MKKVAIITRTKNRNLTLQRTMQSVIDQTFNDFSWIIVNDGGETSKVDQIINDAISLGIDAKAIHNKTSLGMESASNIGIKNSKSKYIALLDDDDTWHPDFLNNTVEFLDDKKNSRFKGVVTHTTVIEETILNNKITQINSYAFDPNLEAITLFQLAKCQSYPNLSFLYARDVINNIGLYREDLPVLGDWEFNLRFLRSYDIGFLPEYLAFYHNRKDVDANHYKQSNENNIFRQTYLFLKNEMLRNDLNTNSIDLGFIINLADEINQLERTIKRGSIIFTTKTAIGQALLKLQHNKKIDLIINTITQRLNRIIQK